MLYGLTVDGDEKNLLEDALNLYAERGDAKEAQAADDLLGILDGALELKEEDFKRPVNQSKEKIGLVGNNLLKLMRQLKQLDLTGNYNQSYVLCRELMGVVSGLRLADWNVKFVPSCSSWVDCVEVEGIEFRV